MTSPYLSKDESIDWRGAIPYMLFHLAAVSVFLTGFSEAALIVFALTFVIRTFGLTAGYHRYFAHKSFKTSRVFQFILAWIGTSALQLGPLWWASHHRHHHRYADTAEDVHPPKVKGFWYAHVGWVFRKKFYPQNIEQLAPDLAKFPELIWMNRHPYVPPLFLFMGLFILGEVMAVSWGTNGWQMIVWGFVLSTVLLYHTTFSVNSFAHLFGSRRFETKDESRNNWIVALLTMGEGWHNNHHRMSSSARQGFYWWELDMTYIILKALSWVGVVWDLKTPSDKVYQSVKMIQGKHRARPAAMASLILLMLVSSSLLVQAKEISPKDPAILSSMSLQGAGTLTFFGLRAYTAKFYTQGESKALSIFYHMPIPKGRIVKAAEENLKENPNVDWESLRERVEQIGHAYESVRKGDNYVLLYHPNTGTQLYLNAELVITIPGDDFAKAYFGIWLSENPLDLQLKKQLLGDMSV